MTIVRNTQVVSISLKKDVAQRLDKTRKVRGQSRSAFIASLIDRETEDERWRKIYKEGREIGKKFKITSEGDVDKILHEAS